MPRGVNRFLAVAVVTFNALLITYGVVTFLFTLVLFRVSQLDAPVASSGAGGAHQEPKSGPNAPAAHEQARNAL